MKKKKKNESDEYWRLKSLNVKEIGILLGFIPAPNSSITAYLFSSNSLFKPPIAKELILYSIANSSKVKP